MRKNNINFLLFILLALLWSGSFLGIKITVEHLPPFFSAMVRVGLAHLFLTLFFLIRKKPLLAPFSTCWRLWIVGIFSQGLPFALLFYGEKTVIPALASILNGTVSLWALLFGFLFFRSSTKFSSMNVGGLLLGFLGIILIFWPSFQNQEDRSSLIGTVSILFMAISYAVGALLNQHLVSGKLKPPFQVSLWQQHWASFLFLLLLSILFENPTASVFANPQVWYALFYLGLFSTAIAWVIFYHLIAVWDAVRATSVMYIVPLLALLWDFLFLDLIPHSYELMGVSFILVSIFLIQKSKKQSQVVKS